IIRACQEMGIPTVAVYTEADREGRHVQLADQAYSLGSDTYLSTPTLFAIAERAGADAIHPGYGFLAENADFARDCAERGITWIGPNPHAIALMGSKTVARRMAAEAGVPVVPGITEALTEATVAIEFANRHGYPCVIKAAAGGGGRGMQVVTCEAEFEAAIAKGIREGEAYFGSGEVFIERYLGKPRHIEIQVLCDRHGHAVALGERECTIQRRHQKLVEECPSVALTPALREAMQEAAVRMAQAVGYDSAGTCEFLYQDGAFYFLEMNTRIQVEHTVTEMVYDVDLVKEQIRIAAGAPMAAELLEARAPRGWALECRVNAEDPAQNFRPSPGLITRYRRPGGPGVRIDDAAYSGYRIPDQYDSMIAKVVTWGKDRAEAIARMKRSLKEMVVEGVPTTIPLHLAILDHPAFVSGDFSTHFIGQDMTKEDLAQIGKAAPEAALPVPPGDEPQARGTERLFEVVVNRELFAVTVSEIGGQQTLTAVKPKKPGSSGKAGSGLAASGSLTAPMHAVVSRVLVELGQTVEAGTPLVVLEAMKMETEIPTAVAGTVVELNVKPGQTVEGGQVLAVVK
ncbi:MAG TPA: biotin carboxylase N-terminal domain-containing protein, partial [Stenomitos sp.]